MLLSECPLCVRAKKGLTCCGEGGTWEGTCGNQLTGDFAHSWKEGYVACADSTTPKPTTTTYLGATLPTKAVTSPPICKSERAPWQVLGYTEDSWDNLFSDTQLPWSSIKYWSSLTVNEKAAAVALGYNQTTWDNESGAEPQPASTGKKWAELIACADGETITLNPYRISLLNWLGDSVW